MRFTLILLLSLFLGNVSTTAFNGKVTWYGNAFQGHKTASGEIYDKEKLTCAHRTYPFGTILRLTNKNNGKSVQVRVNDRGPFVRGIVLDISEAAARAIDIKAKGRATVNIEVVRSPKGR